MLRTCFLLCLLFVFAPAVVRAQGTADIPGWQMVPDSLFLIWHLDQDQIARLRVIEEDYDTERQHVAANMKTGTEQEARLRKLGASRMNEIKGVLGAEYFSDWQHRLRTPASGGQ